MTIPFGLADVLHAKTRACYWVETGVLYNLSAKDQMKHKTKSVANLSKLE
ncbi:MAG: hypothetical protein WAV05_18580 [Anaerolineales bacterium]